MISISFFFFSVGKIYVHAKNNKFDCLFRINLDIKDVHLQLGAFKILVDISKNKIFLLLKKS